MTTKKYLKKAIIEYYRYQPQKFQDFQKLVLDLHEELINNEDLVIREVGVFKTNILGNK